ncbi:MAG: protein phosphatase 2C domain-containing protein [Erysipelotrichia bacterium]|nr:protein phosphatase 2C domain-containing protein [Erysipelotrichia bacterium]
MDSKETKLSKESKEFVIDVFTRFPDDNGEYKKMLDSEGVQKLIDKFLDELDTIAHQIPKPTPNKTIAIKTYQENDHQIKSVLKPPHVPLSIEKVVQPTMKPIFKIQNFKINEEKSVSIEIESPEQIFILDVKLPEDLGLQFDKTSSKIFGTPTQAGDFHLSFQWSNSSGIKSSETMMFSVINNPKNLWKNLPSDKNDPYFKPDHASLILETNTHFMFSASTRGRTHAHVGSFRDDDFFMYTDKNNDWSILIVADGAGSAKSSRKGSLLACQYAGNSIQSNISTKYDDLHFLIANFDSDDKARKVKEQFYYILGEGFKSAVSAIQEEATQKGVPFKEYSTTLLISICFQFNKKLFVASAMIGDGAIAVYTKESNQIALLGMADSGEFAGQTRFLDNSTIDISFWDRVTVGLYDKPTALLLMTDGISDPKFETDNGLKNVELWNKLWLEIQPIMDMDSEKREASLLEWMEFFSPGHHDDRTLAVYKLN